MRQARMATLYACVWKGFRFGCRRKGKSARGASLARLKSGHYNGEEKGGSARGASLARLKSGQRWHSPDGIKNLDWAPGLRVIRVSRALVGQGEGKTCAVWEMVGSPQAATMRFNDGAADAKAHAGSVGLGAKEGVEDLFRAVWWQPHAAIRH